MRFQPFREWDDRDLTFRNGVWPTWWHVMASSMETKSSLRFSRNRPILRDQSSFLILGLIITVVFVSIKKSVTMFTLSLHLRQCMIPICHSWLDFNYSELISKTLLACKSSLARLFPALPRYSLGKVVGHICRENISKCWACICAYKDGYYISIYMYGDPHYNFMVFIGVAVSDTYRCCGKFIEYI